MSARSLLFAIPVRPGGRRPWSPRPALLVLFLFFPSAFAAHPLPRPSPVPSAGKAAEDFRIDPSGVVCGIPFGASEAEVIQRWGEPAGRIRLDAQREGWQYGQDYVLLFFGGQFDACHVRPGLVLRKSSGSLTTLPPLARTPWAMTNGLREGMTLAQVSALLKVASPQDKFALEWSTPATNVELEFSALRGRIGDDAYLLQGVFVARKHEGKDNWFSAPLTDGSAGPSGPPLIGLSLGPAEEGVRVTAVVAGSPADQAGIKPGDILVAIDGKPTEALSVNECTALLQSGDASTLKLSPRAGGPAREIVVAKAGVPPAKASP